MHHHMHQHKHHHGTAKNNIYYNFQSALWASGRLGYLGLKYPVQVVTGQDLQVQWSTNTVSDRELSVSGNEILNNIEHI